MIEKRTAKTKQPFILTVLQFAFSKLGRVFPRMMGKYAYKLWFVPTRFPIPSREQAALSSADQQKLTFGDIEINVFTWGEGPVVLFLHGWSGRSTQVSEFLKPLLDSGFKVLAFDGPAHGLSSGDHTDIIIYSDILKAIVEKYGPLHSVITHSFGAMVFVTAFDNFELKSAVFIAPPASILTPLNHFKDTLTLPDKVANYMQSQLKENYGDDIFDKVSVLGNIGKIELPALIIHDKNDTVVPVGDGQALHAKWKGSSYIETSGLGHMKVLYDKSVIEKVLNFIREK